MSLDEGGFELGKLLQILESFAAQFLSKPELNIIFKHFSLFANASETANGCQNLLLL